MRYEKLGTERMTGTSLQGYCPSGTTYAQLVAAFGEPGANDGYKVDAQWALGFEDGTVATVYNYKTGRNYLEDEGRAVENLVGDDWHIGGKSPEAVARIVELLAEKGGHDDDL